jgi:hypothetical protein
MAISDERRPPRPPPTFQPQRRASPRWLTVAFVAGPLLWIFFLVAVAYVVKHQRAVEIALAVVFISLLVSIALLIPMRIGRVRDEESA